MDYLSSYCRACSYIYIDTIIASFFRQICLIDKFRSELCLPGQLDPRWPIKSVSIHFRLRLLSWPNCFSKDILLFRRFLFLEQEQNRNIFLCGISCISNGIDFGTCRAHKGGFAEQCNQGHEKPKKPNSFQKWQKYGFIKLKLKVHPFETLSHLCFNTIFTSDDRILYDRIDGMVKINFHDREDQSPGLYFRWEKYLFIDLVIVCSHHEFQV